MAKLCASVMFFNEYSTEEVFWAMSSAGLDSLEFWAELPDFWFNECDISKLEEMKRKYPDFFPINFHAPVFDLNPCSINPRVRQATLAYTLESLELLSQLGGGVLTVHPGKRTTKRPVTSFDAQSLETYLLEIEKNLPENVSVGIENMPPSVNAHMVTPAELRRILDEHYWLSFTFDYAHALSGGGDALAFLDECGDRLVNVHASLSSGAKMHAPLSGTAEGNALCEKLSSMHYTGPVTFELEDMNFDLLSYSDKITVLRKEQEFYASLRYI